MRSHTFVFGEGPMGFSIVKDAFGQAQVELKFTWLTRIAPFYGLAYAA
jgi:hypothetical protein